AVAAVADVDGETAALDHRALEGDVLPQQVEGRAAHPRHAGRERLDGMVVDPVERDEREAAAQEDEEDDEEGDLAPVTSPEGARAFHVFFDDRWAFERHRGLCTFPGTARILEA